MIMHPVSDVITLSSEGSILRAWNLPDGLMVWESVLPGVKPSKSLLLVPVSDKNSLTIEAFLINLFYKSSITLS